MQCKGGIIFSHSVLYLNYNIKKFNYQNILNLNLKCIFSRPEHLIRAARHYDDAVQIFIRNAVMSAKQVVKTYLLKCLMYRSVIFDLQSVFAVCCAMKYPFVLLIFRFLAHCSTISVFPKLLSFSLFILSFINHF